MSVLSFMSRPSCTRWMTSDLLPGVEFRNWSGEVFGLPVFFTEFRLAQK